MKHLLFALFLAVAGIASAGETGERPLYSVPVLGDIHYDLIDCHDMEWVNAEMSKDLRQIRNYTRVTEANTPELFRRVEAASALRTEPVPFVIQMGDFTEGLCGSRELQGKLFSHALAAVKNSFKRPFYLVRGNHDVTGPGAWEAGDDVLLPYLRELRNDPETSWNYTIDRGEDRFIFFESMRPDLGWLKQALTESAGKRHVFLVTHYPILPYNYRAHWGMLCKNPQQETERRELLALLEKHNVMILSAHLHMLSLIDRKTANGTTVQMSVSSVINKRDSRPVKVVEGIAAYTPELAAERDATNRNLEWRQSLIGENQPYATRFYKAEFEGYAVLEVYSDRVVMQFYNLSGAEPVLTMRLK